MTLSGDYLWKDRAFVGASYFARQTAGQTPLGYDFVDTASEAQLRAQIPLGAGRKYALGVTTRHDVGQGGRLFDYQVGLSVRGKAIETRFSYGKLGNRFGFGLTIPRLAF